MLYKSCPPPKDGGSAKGVTRYILGYELGDKREEWEVRNASYHALIAESLARPDFGVGTVWKPEIGGGIRPSSVLALNVGMLATADIEMQALYQGNKRVKVATHHEVFAFGDDAGLSDEMALEAVRRVYDRVGLGKAAMVMAVHRDSYDDKGDGHLLLHVHVARSGIDPTTLRAFNHQRINTRISRAERAVEMEMGLVIERHDLAIVDYAATTGEAFIRDSTVPERLAWRRDLREQRLIDLERARYADNARREGSFERYAEARIEPRLRDVIDQAKDQGRRPHAIDIANAAARLGTVIQAGPDGLQLRDVSTARLREEQREEIETFRAASAEWKSLSRDEHLEMLRVKHVQQLAAETRRLLTEGAVAPLTPMMLGELRAALRNPLALADEIATERAFVEAVDKDPGLVSRTITQHTSTFSRADVDRYLVDRIVDIGEIERLGDRIFAEDTSLEMLSPDTADGVWTTREMRVIEEQVAADARALAQTPDVAFSDTRRAQACAAMEAERSTPDEPFVLSEEQQTALSVHGGSLVVILGRSGSGKTTLLEAMRRDAEAAGQQIRGVTIAQAAAIRLEVETGFGAVNTAVALLGDNPRRELIPSGGILVIDEAGMVDSRTMRAILRIARERNCMVVAVGDPRQIQAIGAGGAWRILEAAAREAGTFAELTENRRQSNEYHQRAVALTSSAIEHEDGALFARAASVLEQNGALEFVSTKDDAIAVAVAWYVAEREKSDDVLLVATDRDTVRYLNEEMLRRRVDRGYETRYFTDCGKRGLAAGDRFIFGENDTKLGFVNGDTGTVEHTGKNEIRVRLDRTGEVVKFDSRKYLAWDHGYATTITRAQGASVRALGGIVDGAATAEAFHVLIGRSKETLKVLVPQTAFEDIAELAGHLKERIIAKGTSLDISAEIAKRGGPDTDYARNVNAQRMSAENPARQEWERELTALRNRRDIENRELAVQYRTKAHRLTKAPKSADNPQSMAPQSITNERKRLRYEQRKAEAKIVEQYQPEDFGAWLHRREEQERESLNRMHDLYAERERALTIYHAFSNALDKRTNLGLEQLEIAWRYVWQREYGEVPPMSAEAASTLGLDRYEAALEMAKAHASPLGQAWAKIYLEQYGVEPPHGVELAHLSDNERVVDVLQRACREAGVPVPQRNWNVERERVADQILAEERERGVEQAMGRAR